MNPTAGTTTKIPTTIGQYKIEREIARGGMGIVYLARDTRLDRAVAIKALPDDFAGDPERLQRFEREAKVLASLNHPNIAAIYGFEESSGARYLILEHVVGVSLAEKLADGPLPLNDTLDFCLQIAAGIEAAHEGGVIHRDLKPGNVMITPGDQVKVVDFGLAKGKVASETGIVDSPAASASPTIANSPTLADSPTLAQSPTLPHSPTFASPATMPGVILGTAGYLSPEQARGKPVDRRTDIWSFGCVLYECLTGKLAFEGETVSDTIAKILERDVNLTRLPKRTPARVRELLQRCLEKDPRHRLRDIGDARLALEEARAGGATADGGTGAAPAGDSALRKRLPGVGLTFAFLLGLAVAAAAWNLLHIGGGASPGRGVARLSIVIPSEMKHLQGELTADGSTVIVLSQPRTIPAGERPRGQIYIRRMNQSNFEPLRGTEGANAFGLWPDGKWIVFNALISERTTDRQLLKAPLDGSAPPVPIVKVEDGWQGRLGLLESGDILVPTSNGTEYVTVSRTNGATSKPRRFEAPGSEGSFVFSSSLPADRGVLLEATTYEKGVYRISVAVLDLKSGQTKVLIRDAGNARYSPTGHLLFTRRDALLAIPFELGRLEVKGEPVAITGGLRVLSSWGNARFALSSNGTLLTVPGGNVGQDRHAVVVDQEGHASEWSGERQPFESTLEESPDGNRFASVITNAGAIYQIWISDRGRPSSRCVVAIPGTDCDTPAWSPDGLQIAFGAYARSDADGLYLARTDGSGVPRRIARASADSSLFPVSWSRDGSQLVCIRFRAGTSDIVSVPVTASGNAEPKALFGGTARRVGGRLSPDNRMIAYVSDETGRFETFVSGWDGTSPTGQPLLVSSGGGGRPRWGSAGRSVYFTTPQNKIMSATIAQEPHLSASVPAVVWDLDALRVVENLNTILPDGRLLMIQRGAGEGDITQYDVTLNFNEELRARLKGTRY